MKRSYVKRGGALFFGSEDFLEVAEVSRPAVLFRGTVRGKDLRFWLDISRGWLPILGGAALRIDKISADNRRVDFSAKSPEHIRVRTGPAAPEPAGSTT